MACSSRKNFVIIAPASPNKVGQLWNTDPITSFGFQVDADISISTEDTTGKNAGLAMYITDRVPSAYERGQDFLGASGRFSGLALIVSAMNRDGESSKDVLHITLVEQYAGRAALTWPLDPSVHVAEEVVLGENTFPFKSGAAINLRVVVDRDIIEVFLSGGETDGQLDDPRAPADFIRLLHVKSAHPRSASKSFVGFSASSGRQEQATQSVVRQVLTSTFQAYDRDDIEAVEGDAASATREWNKQQQARVQQEADAALKKARGDSQQGEELPEIIHDGAKVVTSTSTRPAPRQTPQQPPPANAQQAQHAAEVPMAHVSASEFAVNSTDAATLSHGDKIRHLTRLAFKFVSESTSRENTLDKAMVGLQESLKRMADDVQVLNDDIKQLTGVSNQDLLKRLEGDVGSLSTLFKPDEEAARKAAASLETLKRKMTQGPSAKAKGHLEDLLVFSDTSIQNVAASKSTTWKYLFVFMVVLVGAFGMLYRKERQLEKRHIL